MKSLKPMMARRVFRPRDASISEYIGAYRWFIPRFFLIWHHESREFGTRGDMVISMDKEQVVWLNFTRPLRTICRRSSPRPVTPTC